MDYCKTIFSGYSFSCFVDGKQFHDIYFFCKSLFCQSSLLCSSTFKVIYFQKFVLRIESRKNENWNKQCLLETPHPEMVNTAIENTKAIQNG